MKSLAKLHTRQIISIIIVLAVAISAGTYFLIPLMEDSSSILLVKATLGVEASLLPASVWIAEEKGFFRDAGLDITIREFDSGRASFLAMLNGEGVDIATVAPTPIMFESFKRQDFAVFATFASSREDIKVIARKDKGIDTAADLTGKKVGTPAGTTGHFYLNAFLAFNGVSSSEVEMVDIRPPDLPMALKNNQVDAIIIWEPHAHDALNLLGVNGLRLPSSEVYRTTFNFVAMKDFIGEHPEVNERFLRAIDRATIFIQNNNEESQAIVAARLDLDRQLLAVSWDDFAFEVSLDQSLILALEEEARWAITNNLTNKNEPPNFLDYIYTDALDKVKPEAVTIIR